MSNEIGAVFSIKDEFSGKVDGIIGKTGKAEKAIGKTGGAFKKFGGVAAKGAKVAAAGLTAIAGAGVATFAAVNKVVGGFDDIAKTAPKLGITTDALQEMDYWAGQNGVSSEDMEKAVGRLNQRMGEAKAGNEKYSNALTALGVDMQGVKDGTVSTEDAMATSIQALSKMTNEQEKAAMASELFGTKLGRELMPALQDGSLSLEDAKKKAKELGIVIDGDTLAAAEDFADTWDDLSSSMGVFGQKVLGDLMPIFQTMMDWVIENMPAIRDKVSDAFNGAWETINKVFEKIKPGIDFVIEKAKDLYDFISDNWGTIEDVANGVGDAIKYIWEKAKDMYNFIEDNWSLIEPIITVIASAMVAYKLATMAVSTWNGILAASTTVMSAAQGVLNAVMTANPIGIVIVAIGALIGIGIVLYKNWDKIKEKTQELWEKFKDTKAFEVIQKGIDALSRGLEKATDFFQKIKDKFDVFKNAIGKFKVPKWVSTIGGKIGGAVTAMKGGEPEGDFAVGSNSIPRDMIAQVHKSEMIVPASQAKNLRQQGININNIDRVGLNKPIEATKYNENVFNRENVFNKEYMSNKENVLNTDNVTNADNVFNKENISNKENVLNTKNVVNTDNVFNKENILEKIKDNIFNTNNTSNKENVVNTDNVFKSIKETIFNRENVVNKENVFNKEILTHDPIKTVKETIFKKETLVPTQDIETAKINTLNSGASAGEKDGNVNYYSPDNIIKGLVAELKELIKHLSSDSHKSISIAKLADEIIVREEADIDKIIKSLTRELKRVSINMA